MTLDGRTHLISHPTPSAPQGVSEYEANAALVGRAGTTVTLEILLPRPADAAEADSAPSPGGETPAAACGTEPPPPPPPPQSRHVTLVRVRDGA